MSLDVYLMSESPITKRGTGVFIRENGINRELSVEEVLEKFPGATVEEYEIEDQYVYTANITHNLNRMAVAAGIYDACWRPENIKAEKAKDIIPLLEAGLTHLKKRPTHFEKFNASNGWGTYEQFVPWVERYLEACRKFPEAKIEVSR
jgi:hypothetical protein